MSAYVLTFMVARISVFLIMARKIPDFLLYLGGTHVHHLNYGVFVLAAVGGILLFRPPSDRRVIATLYGTGLAKCFFARLDTEK